MNKPLLKLLRILLAIGLFSVGAYWFVDSAPGWYQGGFAVFTSGEKGKDAFSGLLFSVLFMLYGAWELFRLIRNHREK